MHTPLCDELGIEFPIFAFTHCRDVVAAVSKAGGFGVLGAVGFTPEQLEVELQWIDEHIGDKPYGVDIVIPGKYEGMDEHRPRAPRPRAARHGAARSTWSSPTRSSRDAGVPELPPEEDERMRLLGWTEATALPADRGGAAPPQGAPDRQRAGHPARRRHRAHPRRRPEGRGAVRVAVPGPEAQGGRRRHRDRAGRRGRRPHRRGRLDRALAADRQGHRAHPDARRRRRRLRASRSPPRWRWAPRACGPGRCGSPSRRPTSRRPRSSSCSTPTRGDTVRSRSFTGKPCRMLKSEWTEAWERGRHARSAADADAVHGVGQLRRPRPPLRRQGPGGDVQPRRSGGRPAEPRSRRPPR